jgi:cobalt/nickel transport protein
MNNLSIDRRNRIFIGVGLGVSLAISALLSPFASQHPDGLDRVAQDLQFEEKATPKPVSHQLPFYDVFEEYAMRGVPQAMATPLAGVIGTLATFGLAWGLGKLAIRGSTKRQEDDREI